MEHADSDHKRCFRLVATSAEVASVLGAFTPPSLAEQGSSLGNKMKKEGVCPVEARSDMGRIQKCCCHCREKIHMAKAQLETKLARTVREIKKFFQIY